MAGFGTTWPESAPKIIWNPKNSSHLDQVTPGVPAAGATATQPARLPM